MLLTSSQVSVAISSFIIFIFTVALFLSGYVLQQKTVSNIRQAIKPPSRPVHTYMVLPPPPSTQSEIVETQKQEDNLRNLEKNDGVQVVEVEESVAGVRKGGVEKQIPDSSRWELKPWKASNPAQAESGRAIDKTTSVRADDVSRDTKQGQTKADLSLQQAAVKLAESGEPHNQKTKSKPANSNKKGFMFPWTKKSKHGDDLDEDVPLESLSRAARRKRIKNDLFKLGPREPIDMSNVYRPRRRW